MAISSLSKEDETDILDIWNVEIKYIIQKIGMNPDKSNEIDILDRWKPQQYRQFKYKGIDPDNWFPLPWEIDGILSCCK